MVEETHATPGIIDDRRRLKGTWPWFVLNVVLFPAPAYFTLLRIRELRFSSSVRHLGVTFLLFFLLFSAACLQLLIPGAGRLWMALPAASGLIVLYANRSSKESFKPFDIVGLARTHAGFVLFFVLFFTMVSILPDLDFITSDEHPTYAYKIWLRDLPFWQDLLIIAAGLLLLAVGYLSNTVARLSINRAVVLFACLVVLTNLLTIVMVLAFNWLKIDGGFGTQLAIVLLGAILAVDYWDATSIGQYIRRFFFLTCTKGLYFTVLWLSFAGLPQQAAATLSAYYFNQSKPAISKQLNQHLVYSHHDRFNSAHDAARRMRSLYAGTFKDAGPDDVHRLNRLLDEKKGAAFPADADIRRLAELVHQRDVLPAAATFEKTPLFRPIHPDWDVMLTALLIQGAVAQADLNNVIAAFKAMLPQSSSGSLPNIDALHKARYVALATNTRVDFVSPRFDTLEALVERAICPVMSLRLAGKAYWAALVRIDHQSGIAWFRIETVAKLEKSIQLLFDSGESGNYRDDIRSRLLVPLSIDYLRGILEHSSKGVVVFTPAGLDETMPDRFAEADLAMMRRAVAFSVDPVLSAAPAAVDPRASTLHRYAGYTQTVALIKALLDPKPYRQNLFTRAAAAPEERKGIGRLTGIEHLMGQIGPLRGRDRIEIADLMAKNNHAKAASELFVRLAADIRIPSDLVDCSEAFRIGRELFLLGHHQAAYPYLELAFMRHPFDAKKELWHQISRAKLGKPPIPHCSPPEQEPHLHLYYRTLADIRDGQERKALVRLEHSLKKDSHDSMAIHLLESYFSRPVDEAHFFPAPEGL